MKWLLFLLFIPFVSASLGVSPATIEIETCKGCLTSADLRIFSDEPVEIIASFGENSVEVNLLEEKFVLVSIPFSTKKSFNDSIVIETKGKQINSAAEVNINVKVFGLASPVVGMAIIFGIISIGGLIFAIKHNTSAQ